MTELCDLLQSLKVAARLFATVAKVDYVQTYQNTTDQALEISYSFPVPLEAQVTGFTIKIGDRFITSEIEETEKAYQTYDKALQKGDTTVIVESLRKNVLEISLGNLLPSETAEVTLTYLQKLDFTDGSSELTWRIPFVVAPRYDRHPTPESNRIQPAIGKNSTVIELEAHIQQTKTIHTISSPSHPIQISTENGYSIVRLSKTNEKPDRDFVLEISLDALPKNHLFTELDEEKGGFSLLQITPDFPNEMVEDKPKLIGFLLDISGSMDGEKILQARQALKLCLRQLSWQDSFNIIAFSSNFYCFQDSFIPYTESALKNADDWIDNIHESGGTEIYDPLFHLLSMMDHEKDGVVLLFTDGQVSDEETIIHLVEKHADHMQLFSFGIDTAVNESFIDSIAKAGNGLPEYIIPGERIEDKVLRQLDRIRSVSLDLPVCYDENHHAVELYPPLPKRLFANETYTCLLHNESGVRQGNILLKAKINGEEINIPYTPEVNSIKGILPSWWALEKIRILEKNVNYIRPNHEISQKKAIIALSKEYSVLSALTALVAVMPREVKAKGDPNWVRIPVCLPNEWNGIRESFPTSMMDTANMQSFTNRSPDFQMIKSFHSNSLMSFEDTAMYSLEDTIRMAALHQRSDGSIGSSDQVILHTACFILGCLFTDKTWVIYKRACLKAAQFLITQPVQYPLFQVCALETIRQKSNWNEAALMEHIRLCVTSLSIQESAIYASFKKNELYQLVQIISPEVDKNTTTDTLAESLLSIIFQQTS